MDQKLTTTTEPTPVEVGRYDGLYLELTAPTRITYQTYKEKDVDFRESGPDSGRYTGTPGAVDRLWILDVQGDSVVPERLRPTGCQRRTDRGAHRHGAV